MEKIVHDANRYKMVDIKAEYEHKNFAPEKCKSKFAFLLFCICMEIIGKVFKPKTRSFYLNLNSQCVIKNHQ